MCKKQKGVLEDIVGWDMIGWSRYWLLLRVACSLPYTTCSQNIHYRSLSPSDLFRPPHNYQLSPSFITILFSKTKWIFGISWATRKSVTICLYWHLFINGWKKKKQYSAFAFTCLDRKKKTNKQTNKRKLIHFFFPFPLWKRAVILNKLQLGF